jgi:hypothetical protein
MAPGGSGAPWGAIITKGGKLMPTYKMVDAEQLEADLTTVADKIRAKGGTSGKMTFPAGFAEAVESISTGVEVRKASGTFTLQSGQRTVSCGFAPDVVMIHKNTTYEQKYQTCAVNFADDTRGTTLETGLWEGSDSIAAYQVTITQTATGFSVRIIGWSDEWDESNGSGTFHYSAVKFTE